MNKADWESVYSLLLAKPEPTPEENLMLKTGTQGLNSRIESRIPSHSIYILGPAHSRHAYWEREREGKEERRKGRKGKKIRKEGKEGERQTDRHSVCLSTLPYGSQQRKQTITPLGAQSS